MVTEVQRIGQQHTESFSILEGAQKGYTEAEVLQRKQTQAAKKVAESALHYQHEIDAVIDQLKRISDQSGRKLQFSVNKDINRVIIKVIDTATDKVIREIPSEVIQKLRQEFENPSGIFFDQII